MFFVGLFPHFVETTLAVLEYPMHLGIKRTAVQVFHDLQVEVIRYYFYDPIIFYSYLSESTGFAIASLNARYITVIIAITNANIPEATKIYQFMFVR